MGFTIARVRISPGGIICLGRRSRGGVCSPPCSSPPSSCRSSSRSEARARRRRSSSSREYIEGTSNNKALEIYNGTGAPSTWPRTTTSSRCASTGAPPARSTSRSSGRSPPATSSCSRRARRSPVILAQADQTNGAGWFNGDDVVVLRKGATLIDVIGQLGLRPRHRVGRRAHEHRRQHAPAQGDDRGGRPDHGNAFDPAVEWDGFATDTFDGLGSHTLGRRSPDRHDDAGERRDRGRPRRERHRDLQRARRRDRLVVHDRLHHERPALGAASGGPTTFTLDPDVDFADGEACTVDHRRRPGRGPGRRRPAGHDGGRLRLQLHDARSRSTTSRAPRTSSPLAGRMVSGVAGHRHRRARQRLLPPGSDARRR